MPAGWLTGARPTGDKLKGEEFKRARNVLTGEAEPAASVAKPKPGAKPQPSPERQNVPLAESDNEMARDLVTLDERFILDVAQMPPPAASYIRRHPCLSPALMQKWRVGVLPNDAGSDKRGWGLRGQVLYPILSETGKLLAWVARNPQFESKELEFNTKQPEERTKEKKPAKRRFPVDFHRGLELFGQHASPNLRHEIVQLH